MSTKSGSAAEMPSLATAALDEALRPPKPKSDYERAQEQMRQQMAELEANKEEPGAEDPRLLSRSMRRMMG